MKSTLKVIAHIVSEYSTADFKLCILSFWNFVSQSDYLTNAGMTGMCDFY